MTSHKVEHIQLSHHLSVNQHFIEKFLLNLNKEKVFNMNVIKDKEFDEALDQLGSDFGYYNRKNVKSLANYG